MNGHRATSIVTRTTLELCLEEPDEKAWTTSRFWVAQTRDDEAFGDLGLLHPFGYDAADDVILTSAPAYLRLHGYRIDVFGVQLSYTADRRTTIPWSRIYSVTEDRTRLGRRGAPVELDYDADNGWTIVRELGPFGEETTT